LVMMVALRAAGIQMMKAEQEVPGWQPGPMARQMPIGETNPMLATSEATCDANMSK
jgi:hypothetical protein